MALISALVSPKGITRAAIHNGFPANTPGPVIIRHALAKLIGMSDAEAMQHAQPSSRGTMESGKHPTQVTVSDELLERAKSTLEQNTNQSFLIRYALALDAGYNADDAADYAAMKPGPKSSKTRNSAAKRQSAT